MSKIGILGGTFNPIHYGHLILAQNALEEAFLDKVLFIPSGNSYMKRNVLPANHRYEMTRIAISSNPLFSISDIEVMRDGNSYTCETLQQLQMRYPDDTFYFICGADTLFSIETWYQPQDIMNRCHLLCMNRSGYPQEALLSKKADLETAYSASIILLSGKCYDISSSELRERIRQHKQTEYYMPQSVLQYIEQNHLYDESL